MGVNTSVRLLPETLRRLAFGSIGAAYMGVGAAFGHPIRLIHIQNFTDQLLLFSFDGVNDHIALPTNAFILLDVTANKTQQGSGFYISEGDRVYVKEDTVTPTSGSVFVSVFYGKE